MENELMTKVDLMFENNVFKTEDNEKFKNILLELIEERKKFKEMVKQTHNDMDLGKLFRSHFINDGIYSKNQ
jgi:hypothetical protein